MPSSIIVSIVLGDMVELFADTLRDVFDDLGVAVDVVEVSAEERLVECEDAFDFDAEGDLEGGVDHVDGFLLMGRRNFEMLILVKNIQDECVQARYAQINHIYLPTLRKVLAGRTNNCNLRQEGTQIGIHGLSTAKNGPIRSHTDLGQ